ncbi:MAG: hypothetical protein H0X45_08600, partial [Planctomycetes bacterium]|nr:hypothetical protein [Planctomycetota bacterium]
MSPRLHRSFWLVALIAATSFAVEPMVAVGEKHTVYLADDGTVWCWGDNANGQLGDGTTTRQLTAKRVSDAAIVDIVAVAAGSFNTFALRADGTLWSWGRNTEGSLGRNSVDPQFTSPGLVLGLAVGVRLKAVAAGDRHALALSDEGRVYVWGADNRGQMGDGGLANIAYMARDTGLTGIKAVAAGADHSLVLTAGGKMKAWGAGTDGQIGDGGLGDRTVPTSVTMGTLDFAMTIACGARHNVAIYGNGTGHTWGDNADGQCGNGTQVDLGTPSVGNVFGQCRAVSAGARHTLAQRLDGLLVVCGDNSVGQLRLTATIPRSLSPSGAGVTDGRALASGPMAMHTMLLRNNGRLSGFGAAANGQLGNGAITYAFATDATAYARWPVSKLTAVATGQYHSTGLKSDGTVWGWGAAHAGQVGDGGTTNRSAPVLVTGIGPVCAIAAGADHGDFSVALRTDGSVVAWGANDDEEIGNPSAPSLPSPNPHSASPLVVSNTSGNVSLTCRAIGAGDHHGLAVKQDGSVVAWGSDGDGQLGNGAATGDQEVPVTVTSLANVLAVAGGGGGGGAGFSLALRADGSVWAWGRGWSGELGNGLGTSSDVPVQVSVIGNIIAIAAGSFHAMALRSDGTVWCWGTNGNGALGDNTTVNRFSPVQVRVTATTFLTGIKAISGGAYHSVAAGSDGSIWTWGANYSYALGDLSTGRTVAASIAIPGLISCVDAGYNDNMIVLADGAGYGWGNNGYYHLGNTSTGQSADPLLTDPTWLPQVTLTVLDASASETGPDSGSFMVSRDSTRSLLGSLTVDLAYAGVAVDGDDYLLSPTGLTIIPPGSASATVTVTPIDDPDDEDVDFEDVVPQVVDQPEDYQNQGSGGVVTIADDDVAGVMVSAISANTRESDAGTGISRTFLIWLASRPTDPVELYFYSSNESEGLVDADPTAGNQGVILVTFQPNEYGIGNAKVIQVFGQQDAFDDGDVPYNIVNYYATSDDPRYEGNVAPAVGISSIDDDTAGINVASAVTAVTEASGAAQTQAFIISLTSEPYFPVYFALSSSDPSEGNVHPEDSTIALHSGNWSSGATVRVVGQDDAIDDGDVAFTIIVAKSSSDDGAYNGKGAWSIDANCTDNDTRGVVISPGTSRLVSEAGVTAAYSVR